ncbi:MULTISPECIES: ABC transporter ATP-binding protein [unclassified Crossiella]|uniref:ATP-binding cassette domain-containing protein n=1 Tax=unclassified Crossiella TaxID=2620835 RepID=UPI001FFEF7A1|nr:MULTISPECIES: ABC transporter ATP-binding protein [unclassified Crossiella]MCK2240627.1 ABC transporter ATP-binding protein/permease [Crossiella sp. S99.2]MCK2252922.1 ABC transporter ATP-binding protein/permease [Crossiella sp. S99.1]
MRSSFAAIRLLVGTALRVDRRRALLVLILSPLLNVVAAAQAIGLQWLVDGAAGRSWGLAVWGGVLLGGVTVAVHQWAAISTDLRQTLQQRIGLELDRRLMTVCAGPGRIGHFQDPEFLDTAELLRQRRGEFSIAFAALVENANLLARFLAAAVVLTFAHPLLALLPLFVLPLAQANRWQAKLVNEAEQAGAAADRRRLSLFALATDAAAARELRLYRLGGEFAARHAAAFAEASGPRETARLKAALAVAGGWLIFAGALLTGLYLLARSVFEGTASAGAAVLVVLLATRLVGATTGLSWLLGWLRRSLHTIGLFVKLADHPQDTSAGGAAAVPERGELVLSGVGFQYPGQSSPALTSVDLRLPAGSTVAVVGDNGAGKSTLVALLAGLHAPSHGVISFAGQDLAEVDPAVWQGRVTACFQDFCRFELLVRQSVGVGELTSLDDESAVRAALLAGGADGVVATLPSGLDTQLGKTHPEGTELSGGQWQKLALARARMRTAPALVLLDEPAAGLDPDSEAELLRRYLAERGPDSPITVVVSHRFSTVRQAELIVVLRDGRVTETGTHTGLLAAGGHYADMYALHAAAYLDGPPSATERQVTA